MNLDETLKERGGTHGDYTETAEFCQIVKALMRRSSAWHRMTPWMQETLDMIAHKMARICCGDPYHMDHWVDVGGYNKLTVDRLSDYLSTPRPVPTPTNMIKTGLGR